MSVRQILPQRFLIVVVALALPLAGCGSTGSRDADNASASQPKYVTALGRVTPGRAVMSISAQPGTRLLKLEVKELAMVHAGDPLAYLDSYPLRLAERDAAVAALAEARDRMSANSSYARAQMEQSRQNIRLLDVGVAYETSQVARMKKMTDMQAIPRQRLIDEQFALDSKTGERAKAQADLVAAQAALTQAQTEAGIKSAEAAVQTATAQLELTIIRAPMNGQILKVFTYAGERIGDNPILSMSDTSDMHVIAEVYETDVGKLRVGQHATITSPALPGPVDGRVEEIGALIYKNNVLALDPRAPTDTRVVEVRIKLAPSAAIARLTNLEVSTRIDLSSGPR